MDEEDFSFLDDNAAVQGDNMNYDPSAEPSQWTGDYGGYDWSMPETGQNNNFNFDSNISNSPVAGWSQNGTDWEMVDQQTGSNYSNPLIDMSNSMPSMGSIQNTLSSLFNNKGLVTGLGALMEGSQNKKRSAALQQLVSKMQPAMDPFGSQRGQYQQELSRTMQNPYSAPIVQQQVNAMQQAQAIKDAAAGRRSNSATSSPALLAAQAQVAQKYMDSLYTPSGANISPSSLSSLMSASQSGINSDVNGYMSPIMTALARNAGTDQNTQTLEVLKKFFTGGK